MVMAEAHGGVYIFASPTCAVVSNIVKGAFVPMRLIFHRVVNIIGLKCYLLLHRNLEERQEDFNQIEIGGEISEYRFDFAKHFGGLLQIVRVAGKRVVDDEQHGKSAGSLKE